MVDTLNALTALVISGKLSCGEYAARVNALQAGQSTQSDTDGEKRVPGEPSTDPSDVCPDCGAIDDADTIYVGCCEDCYQTTCTECGQLGESLLLCARCVDE